MTGPLPDFALAAFFGAVALTICRDTPVVGCIFAAAAGVFGTLAAIPYL